jgi:hypothetical protein
VHRPRVFRSAPDLRTVDSPFSAMIAVTLQETLPAFVHRDPRTRKRFFEHLVGFRLHQPLQDVVLSLMLQHRDPPQEAMRFRQDFDLD